jgi:hypothetical protein
MGIMDGWRSWMENHRWRPSRSNSIDNSYLPTGLNRQKLLILAAKNSKCIPTGRSFLGFHLLMGFFWDFSGIFLGFEEAKRESQKSLSRSQMSLGLFWDNIKVPGS